MGICEDVGQGVCEVEFVMFMVEVSIVGFALLCRCLIPCWFGVQQASRSKADLQRENEQNQELREMGQRGGDRAREMLKRIAEMEQKKRDGEINGSDPDMLAASSFPTFRQNQQMIYTQQMYPLKTNHPPFIDPRQF